VKQVDIPSRCSAPSPSKRKPNANACKNYSRCRRIRSLAETRGCRESFGDAAFRNPAPLPADSDRDRCREEHNDCVSPAIDIINQWTSNLGGGKSKNGFWRKTRGAGERVLESRHVIGLFMLMLLFSGVFFTLGYVMGRNEIDGPVRAATDFFGKPGNSVFPRRTRFPSARTLPLLSPHRRTRPRRRIQIGSFITRARIKKPKTS